MHALHTVSVRKPDQCLSSPPPAGPRAATRLWVRRNGTRSGTLSEAPLQGSNSSTEGKGSFSGCFRLPSSPRAPVLAFNAARKRRKKQLGTACLSKMTLKSRCTTPPCCLCSRMLSRCRSPSPSRCPICRGRTAMRAVSHACLNLCMHL